MCNPRLTKLCPCGSGQQRRDLIDVYGVFCTFVCDRCEARVRRGFNPAIFDTSHPGHREIAEDYGEDC